VEELQVSYEVSILFLVFALGSLAFSIVRGLVFKEKFNTITLDMSYDQVLSLLGPSSDENYTEGITTCVWKKKVIRGVTITRIVVFKDGKVFSIL